MTGNLIGVERRQRGSRFCAEPAKGSEFKGVRIKLHDDDTPARLGRQGRIDVEAPNRGAAEGRLELDVAHGGVHFGNKIVAAVIYLRLEHLHPTDALQPKVSHDLPGKQVFKEHLPVGRMDAVLV